jgi:hypothetical protein
MSKEPMFPESARAAMGIGIGSLFAVVGLVFLVDTIGFVREAEVADGIVVAQRIGPNHVTIAYPTPDGEVVEVDLSTFDDHEVGDQVRLRYLPTLPLSSPRVDTFVGVYGFAVGFLGGGLLALLLSILSFRRARRHEGERSRVSSSPGGRRR